MILKTKTVAFRLRFEFNLRVEKLKEESFFEGSTLAFFLNYCQAKKLQLFKKKKKIKN